MITIDKTKELEHQLGWTPEELDAVLTKMQEKSREVVAYAENWSEEELQAKSLDICNDVMSFTASLATTSVQLFYLGVKASHAMIAISKQIEHNKKRKEIKAAFAKMGPLGEAIEKMMSGDEKEGTESPSVTPGPAKVD